MPLAPLIDTHIHLGALDFEGDLADVIARANAVGVVAFVCIGAGYGKHSIEAALRISEGSEIVFAAIGVHPQDTELAEIFGTVEGFANDEKVVAIGETGLDYYRGHTNRDQQQELFRKHIRLAVKCKKPLIIHSRNGETLSAAKDCLSILRDEGADRVGGVFHCYSEDSNFAESLRELNFLVSFPGIITFKKATSAQIAAREIPLSQIMVETDAPFLAPEPFRGKRCESAFMEKTARKLAAIKEISYEEICRETSLNAVRLFRLPEDILGE